MDAFREIVKWMKVIDGAFELSRVQRFEVCQQHQLGTANAQLVDNVCYAQGVRLSAAHMGSILQGQAPSFRIMLVRCIKAGWRWLALAAAIGCLVAVANFPATTRIGINYQVSTRHIPLYQKAIAFVDRDIQMRAVAREATGNASAPEDELMALLRWTHDHVQPTPAGFPVVDDHPYYIVVRGYGEPDQAADVFSTLAAYDGIPAALLFSYDAGHRAVYAFAAAEVNGAWSLFDVREERAFRDGDGRLLNLAALRQDPELLAHLSNPPNGDGLSYPTLIRDLQPLPDVLRTDEQMPLRRLEIEVRKRTPL
ncbi:MAG TPA: transglutaminase domain-containing protein [Chloroflexota bacterium]|nr:transglutaminase domain-containing protein [Chloroflexota bacterium]